MSGLVPTPTMSATISEGSFPGEIAGWGQAPAVQRHIAETQSKWTLVWCTEHCHKPSSDILRATICEHAKRANGEVVCFKKAYWFGEWLSSSAPTTPWVLLTDWREAKPCMQILADKGVGQPAQMLVYTEGDKQQKKSEYWCHGLSPELRRRVRILPYSASMHDIAERTTSAMTSLDGRSVLQHMRLSLSDLLPKCQWSKCEVEQEHVPTLTHVEPALAMGGSFVPASPSFCASTAQHWNRSVADVMARVVSSASSKQVKQMLLFAAPECYED